MSPIWLMPQHLAVVSPLWWLDLAVLLWCSIVLIRIWQNRSHVFWISYTGYSWVLMMIRAACRLAAVLDIAPAALLHRVAEALRFPVLAQATITFSVWNFVLTPFLYWTVPTKTAEERLELMRLNFSWVMVSLHVLNLPLACVNTVFGDGMRPLIAADLWLGLAFGLLYLLFYLLVLDRFGIHLYPPFSPRSRICLFSYSCLVLLYVVSLCTWNALITQQIAIDSTAEYS